MKKTLQKLQEIKENGYQLDFGDAFSQAFENYKKIALSAGCLILLLVIAISVLVGSFIGIALGIGSYSQFLTDYNPTAVTTTSILINLFSSIIGAGLLAPLTAGILKMAHSAEVNIEFSFSTAFDYYKSAYFKNLFVASIIIALFSSGVVTFINLLNLYFEDTTLNSILIFISFFVSFLTPIFTLLTIPLIIFGNLTAVEAIKGSLILVSKRFWTIFFLIIIGIMCAMIGILGFCIGIFFTAPFIYSLEYIIYRNALIIEEQNELDEIGTIE